ncbi:MAG: hypothetical protein IK104_02100 [Clostridia bacterium]|nr:hypothetical protein [Clostridia bacterium]
MAFFIALAVAVCSFAGGIYFWVHNDPGWFDIGLDSNETAPLYADGVALRFYLDGKSNDIRVAKTEIKKLCSERLSRYYMLFDGAEMYPDVVNLASVNQTPGAWVALPDEVYEVLCDAWAKTQKHEGYSVLAGALNEFWQTQLYLTDPQATDPLLDPDAKKACEALAAAINDPNELNLEFRDASKEVRLTKSASYVKLEEELAEAYGISGAVLDLGLLKESYLVAYTAQALADAGYDTGLFTTRGGLYYCMAGLDDAGTIDVMSYVDGEAGIIAEKPLAGGTVVSLRRAFPFETGEFGYYAVTADGESALRSPQVSALTGDVPDERLAVYVKRENADVLTASDAAYDSLIAFLGGTLPEEGECWYVLPDAPKTLLP